MSDLARGDRLCGRFILMAKIGAGGQSDVWRARDLVRREEVALKILRSDLGASPEAWAALEHEYAVSRAVGHPGILKVYEPLRSEGLCLLPMAFASGGDLSSLRGEPYGRVVPALIEIAQAIEHAHGRGVVHRDLKPGNVLLDADGHTMIADFGVASFSGGSPFADHGSPFSASPQALRGEAPSPSDDIYGLGALAYELLSGYPPFYPRFEPQKVFEEPVPELKPTRPVPPRLIALVMRMLAKSREARPVSMRAVIDELHASLHDTVTIETEVLEASDAVAAASDPVTTDWVEIAEHEVRVESAPVEVIAAVDVIAAGDAPPFEAVIHETTAASDELDVPLPAPMGTTPSGEKRGRGLLWFGIAAAVIAVVAVFAWLPRLAPSGVVVESPVGVKAPAGANKAAQTEAELAARLATLQAGITKRVAAIEARAASVWGGSEFAAVKNLVERAVVKAESAEIAAALADYEAAGSQLAKVEARAPEALAAQLERGDEAIAAGEPARARSAYELAQRIDPQNARAAAGLKRAQSLDAAIPLLAEAANAATAGDVARAASLYEKALAADPANAVAQAGLDRARAQMSAAEYARELANGFGGLRGGNLAAARTAFERARALQPGASAAQEGMLQVTAAEQSRAGDEVRDRAARFEEAERWDDALKVYDEMLSRDSTLQFAREGRERVAPRAELARRLQILIDRPDRLATPGVRREAEQLLAAARARQPQGPVIRSQIARVELLIPAYDQVVRVALESDNATEVAIQRVGPLGAFTRREIELKPGRYTLTGTRVGFRDIRRDITIAPGVAVQTISVSCVEPI